MWWRCRFRVSDGLRDESGGVQAARATWSVKLMATGPLAGLHGLWFAQQPRKECNGITPGARCHVKNSVLGWTFEELQIPDIQVTTNLLARILIAKIDDEPRLIGLLRRLPLVQDDPNWRCRTWAASTLAEIAKDRKCVGTAELDWQKIEAAARKNVGEKTASGRHESFAQMQGPRPTWSMLEHKEIVA